MSIVRKFNPGGCMTLTPNTTDTDGDDTIAQFSTGGVDRDNEIIVQAGISYAGYMSKNPMVLWQHDRTAPVARVASMWLNSAGLVGRIKWPPMGISAKSDEVRGLVKAGVLSAISICFKPIQAVLIDPKNSRGPKKYLQCELLEISWVTVPSNPDAIVIQRSAKADDGREKRMARFRRDLDLIDLSHPRIAEIEAGEKARQKRLEDLRLFSVTPWSP